MPNPVARSAIPEYSKIKYNNHLIGRMTDTHGGYEDQELFYDYSPQKSEYSNTQYTDWDNIFLNKFRNLMVDIQENLGKLDDQYYMIYNEYFYGHALSDMLDNQNKLSEIPAIDDEFIRICEEHGVDPEAAWQAINQTIRDYKEENGSEIAISDAMLDLVLIETVSTENGYDAMVLQMPNGDYIITNCCTDADSANDLIAIAYPMLKCLIGDDSIIGFLFNSVLNKMDVGKILDIFENTDLSMDQVISIYTGQIDDNVALIEKYANEAQKNGDKIHLSGYSLGGGIQEAAYSEIMLNSNYADVADVIDSVTLYNPFSLYLEIYLNYYVCPKQDILLEEAIDKIVGEDSNFLIYSAEEDAVSLFNNIVDYLVKNTRFIIARDVQSNSIESFGDLFDFIIGSGGNHGFAYIHDADNNSFDEFGNISELGKFTPISESVDNGMGLPNDKVWNYTSNYSLNPELLIADVFNLAKLERMVTNLSYRTGYDLRPAYKILKEYILNNVGHYSYESFANTIVDVCMAIVDEMFNHTFGIFSGPIKFISNVKGDIREFLYDLLNDEAVKKNLIGATEAFLSDNNEALAEYLDFLLKKVEVKGLVAFIKDRQLVLDALFGGWLVYDNYTDILELIESGDLFEDLDQEIPEPPHPTPTPEESGSEAHEDEYVEEESQPEGEVYEESGSEAHEDEYVEEEPQPEGEVYEETLPVDPENESDNSGQQNTVPTPCPAPERPEESESETETETDN